MGGKGYGESGASVTRRALKGFLPKSGAPFEDIDFNNYTLRQRSRMLYQASPIATSAINTSRTKIVGVGLTLKSNIDYEFLGMDPDTAKEWQTKTETEFALWAEKKQNCDAIGVNNFLGLQQLALKTWLTSGDCFALVKRYKATPLNPYTLRIHLIEADRISTPDDMHKNWPYYGYTEGTAKNGNRIHDGVEVDSNGMITAYYIRNTYPQQVMHIEETKWQRVEAYGKKTGMPNILQISDSERPDQYRGVPYLAQVIEPLLQLRRYTDSEIMAAMIQSFFTAWIETELDPSDMPFNEVGTGDLMGNPGGIPQENNESLSDNEYELGPGTVNIMKPGEKVQFGNPNIPSTGFDTFVKTICKLVGAALEIPYDVLIKEFDSSYSASRGALMEAWEAVKMRRAWFVDDFCQPVYEMWLAEAVALGRIKAPGFWDDPMARSAWSGARWIGPVQGSLDPKKEAEAALLHINAGLKTHEQVTREIGGGDWEENAAQLAQENNLLSAANPAPAPIEGDETDADTE